MGEGAQQTATENENTLAAADDVNSSSESSEFEDTGRIPRAKENRFLANLLRIRRKDKDIFEQDTQLFSSSSSSDEENEPSGDHPDDESEPAPLYLKDVQTGRLMAEGADVFSTSEEDDDEDDEDDDDNVNGLVEGAGSEYDEGKRLGHRISRLNYNQDQKLLRSQFLEAAAQSGDESDGGDFGGLERVRRDNPLSSLDEEGEAETQALLDNLFEKGDALTQDDAFLKDFIANQRWVDSGLSGEEGEDEGPDPNEDEEFLEKADTHEATYNYRFEEPGSAQIVTYPRFSTTSVRKTEGKRKRQRERKKQRKAEKRQQDLLALKTEKNVKRKQIQSKIQELSSAAGGGGPTKDLLEELLTGDFNTDEWDAKMAATYDDDYYEHEDGEWVHKRQKATREIASEGRAELQHLIQDYYGLDHEDEIDGVKCRFRYVEVPKDSYGLSVEEILCLDDEDLNKFVGRRQLDAYREDAGSYKVNPYKLKEIRRRVDFSRLKRKPDEPKGEGGGERMAAKDDDDALEGEAQDGGTNDEITKQKRMASYSRDTLQPKIKKGKEGESKKKKKRKQLPATADTGEKMPKAQRKNLAKKRRRELKRAKVASASAATAG